MATRPSAAARPWGLATRNAPQLYTGYLTYSAGIPWQPPHDQSGGGKVPVRMPRGTFQPIVALYTTPGSDLTGGGSLVARFPTTMPLTTAGRRTSIG